MSVPNNSTLTGWRNTVEYSHGRQALYRFARRAIIALFKWSFGVMALWSLPIAALAQGSDRDHAAHITVDMANFKYLPSTIALHHGQPYVFEFVNKSGISHNFVAKQFFAAATIDTPGKDLLDKGEINLAGHKTTEVRLIAPPPGTYDVHCSHIMHSVLGMKGNIVVD